MKNKKPTAADFFAGIGGMRLGFERAGFENVYANEIDPRCCEVYQQNFGENPQGDITALDPTALPDFDVFVGGFPCQPFSMAGKRNGFQDERAAVIGGIKKVLTKKKPKAVFLENVKHFRHIKNGEVFDRFKRMLEECGYNIFTCVLNSADFGVPQRRERLYVVGLRKDLGITDFEFPKGNGQVRTVGDVLEDRVPLEYYLSKKILRCLRKHRARHARRGNGFGFAVLEKDASANTLVGGNMGRERNLIKDTKSINRFRNHPDWRRRNAEKLRYLTPRECARLQGFPDKFKLHKYKTRAYRQVANSVSIPVVKAISSKIYEKLTNLTPLD